jgi:glycosyltransferase involved in cell wall biosynthesis
VRWWNASAFYAVNIARLLNKHGHQVWVGADPTYPAYGLAQAYGIKVAPLSFYGNNPFKLTGSLIRMIRLIRKENIDIINSHRSEDHSFGLLAKYLCGTKLVNTRGDQRRIKSQRFSGIRYRLTDAVILTCKQQFSDNEKVFADMRKRVHIIHGSVDEDHFRPSAHQVQTAAKYKLPTDKTIFGMVGRLSRVKDQVRFVDTAILLARKRNELHFLVAGKDVDLTQAKLRRRVQLSGVEKQFTFLPRVDDIADVINLIDIGVILSIASETISRVLLEFMYLGKPVIATDINAIGEIVVPGVTGERIPIQDGPALLGAMIKLADDPDRCRIYGRNAAKVYGQAYSEATFHHRYLAVFNNLMKKSD